MIREIVDDAQSRLFNMLTDELSLIPFIAARESAFFGLTLGWTFEDFTNVDGQSILVTIALFILQIYSVGRIVYCHREWKRVLGRLTQKDRKALAFASHPMIPVSFVVSYSANDALIGGGSVGRLFFAVLLAALYIFISGCIGSKISHKILHN